MRGWLAIAAGVLVGLFVGGVAALFLGFAWSQFDASCHGESSGACWAGAVLVVSSVVLMPAGAALGGGLVEWTRV